MQPDAVGRSRPAGCGATKRPSRSSAAQLQGRASLTDEEVAQRQKIENEQEGQRLAGAEGAAVGRGNLGQSPIRGNEYNSFWQDHGRPRQVHKQTSLVVDPADGQHPVYARREEGRRARLGALRRRTLRVVSRPGHRRTLPDRRRHRVDVAGAQRRPQPHRAEPGLRDRPARGVLDRRSHPGGRAAPGGIRQWFGNAVGKWDGNTLVVETADFIDRTNYEWATIFTRPSETLRLVERFTRTGPTTMDYRITVEDPATSSARGRRRFPSRACPTSTLIYEYACHEGNYAMANLLAGGRVDAARRETVTKVIMRSHAPRCCSPPSRRALVRAPDAAHQAFAAEFDASKPIKLRGTVVKMEWINPHTWLHLEVKRADGKTERWMIEGGPPNALYRRGFKQELAAGRGGDPGRRVSRERRFDEGERPRADLLGRAPVVRRLVGHRRAPRRQGIGIGEYWCSR